MDTNYTKVVFAGLFLCLNFSLAQAQQERPNIVVILTDQQSSTALSIAGNKWVKTPHLDNLAKRGVRFTKAYASNPVCVPSKFSMQSGLFPSIIGMRHNKSKIDTAKNEKIIKDALGWKFRRAGYQAVFGGKVHLPGHKEGPIAPYGYSLLGNDGKIVKEKSWKKRHQIIRSQWNDPTVLAEAASQFLEKHKDDKQPFVLFLSFIAPHDICFFTLGEIVPNNPLVAHFTSDKLKRVRGELWETEKRRGANFFATPDSREQPHDLSKYAPPLPDNFEPMAGEPQAIRDLIALRPFREKARRIWGEKGWREHRWMYARLTSIADSVIGSVLQSLDNAGLQENTVVAFTSDHGDNDASHRLEHKTVFYDEASRIPFIFAGPGITQGEVVDHPVSMGTGLYPTLLDLARADVPDGLPGQSLRPYLEGKEPKDPQDYVFMENQIGFAVTDGRFKYAWYDTTNEEMFIDLKNDPGEMVNIIPDIKCDNHAVGEKNTTELRNKYNELQKALFLHLKQLNQQGADIKIAQY